MVEVPDGGGHTYRMRCRLQNDQIVNMEPLLQGHSKSACLASRRLPYQYHRKTAAAWPAAASRHPEYNIRVADGAAQLVEVANVAQKDVDTPSQLDDPRYIRADFSTVLSYGARQGFARAIQHGETRMCVAEAALWASAEDDALASHSTVPFPVAAFMDRISRCTQHVRGQLAQAGLLHHDADQATPDPEAVLQVVEAALFAAPRPRPGHSSHLSAVNSLGFRVPSYGRSAVPAGCVVDHAGVWEVAREAYLHEVLIRRQGHPAALACIYAQVMAELLVHGDVDFAVSMNTGSYQGVPTAIVLPGITRDRILRAVPGQTLAPSSTSEAQLDTYPQPQFGSSSNIIRSTWSVQAQIAQQASEAADTAVIQPLNTCSSDVLVELQRHLKRAYWCWAWDSRIDGYDIGGNNSHGGFRASAKAALGDDAMTAAIAAISRVAAWRLDRGIFTSPGAGDLIRARAAAERLVLLTADSQPDERRDLAVLLLHSGELGAARAELRSYMRTAHFSSDMVDPFDKVLCQRLMQLLESAGDGVYEPEQPLSVQRVLSEPAPTLDDVDSVKKPLVW